MFDWNKPFRTRDGRPARLEHKLSKPTPSGETHLVEVDDGDLEFYFPDGSFEKEECPYGVVSCSDLVNLPEKKVVERWVVVGSHDGVCSHSSREYAQQTFNDWRNLGRVARIHHIREEF